jgi:shikimate dehydrogenase
MKLGLLGYPITHSLSPELYRKFLGSKLTSYQLFEIKNEDEIPSLKEFSRELNGLNITSPYKTHFINQITIESSLVTSLGAVNTLAFLPGGKVLGTNTDVLAVVEILKNYISQYSGLKILLLGDGVMANMTKLVAKSLNLELQQFSRKTTEDFAQLDLRPFQSPIKQTLIINSCSRDFVFRGQVSGSEIFWDYNYSFLPHQNSLPPLVKAYHDGQRMLELQAKAAITFWNEVIPKLN